MTIDASNCSHVGLLVVIVAVLSLFLVALLWIAFDYNQKDQWDGSKWAKFLDFVVPGFYPRASLSASVAKWHKVYLLAWPVALISNGVLFGGAYFGFLCEVSG